MNNKTEITPEQDKALYEQLGDANYHYLKNGNWLKEFTQFAAQQNKELKDLVYQQSKENVNLSSELSQQKELVEEKEKQITETNHQYSLIYDKYIALNQEIEALKKENEEHKYGQHCNLKSMELQSLRIKELEKGLTEAYDELKFHNWDNTKTGFMLKSLLSTPTTEHKEVNQWICNSCNTPNFTQSVSQEEIDNETLSCISCGGFEFHLK